MATFDQEAGRLSSEQTQCEGSPERENAMLVLSGIIMAVTFMSVLQPPGGTNDKGQSNLRLRHFVPFVIFNTVASTAASLHILELIKKFRVGFLAHLMVVGLAMSYGAALLAITQHSARTFATILPIVTLILLWGCRVLMARCC